MKLARDGSRRGMTPRTPKQLAALRLGHIASAKVKTTHGMSYSIEYGAWAGMRGRCHNPNDPRWSDYGGRGISVCERWSDFSAFFEDMGPRPDGTSLDRIDCNGNYEPSNCRWATPLQQMQNTRRNVNITFNGETLPVSEWSRRLGLNKSTIRKRIARGWSREKALEPRRWERRMRHA